MNNDFNDDSDVDTSNDEEDNESIKGKNTFFKFTTF